ncbi:hypothetical protein C8F01DRAFT_1147102 [Mycena amicta]|nr:hypothetical protein C8F01DRAFT_1147102 [Mycena amicta]
MRLAHFYYPLTVLWLLSAARRRSLLNNVVHRPQRDLRPTAAVSRYTIMDSDDGAGHDPDDVWLFVRVADIQ